MAISVTDKILQSILDAIKVGQDSKNQKYFFQYQAKARLYAQFIDILILFPDDIPTFVLSDIEFPPVYLGEFETVAEILDIKIADIEKQIERREKTSIINDLKTKIDNMGHVKKSLKKIVDQYKYAKKKLDDFMKKNYGKMKLFASQEVLNLSVVFDVTIHNAFDHDTVIDKDSIIINRGKLIDQMRAEIHIFD